MKRIVIPSLLVLGLLAAACATTTGNPGSTSASGTGGAGGSGGPGGATASSSGTGGNTTASSSTAGGTTASSSTAASSTAASSTAASSTAASSTAASSTASSSSGGPSTVSASLSDVGLYVDCAKSGADQLQGIITIDFASSSAVTETVSLTAEQVILHNGVKSLTMAPALKWSAANSQAPGQIPAGGVNGILYKEQSGAPAPAMDPCSLCPIHNNNVAPSIDVTMTWDHGGSSFSVTKSMASLGCLNMF